MDSYPLTATQVADYERDGFLVLRDFYDQREDIEPIQRSIYDIIGLVIRRHRLPIEHVAFTARAFASGFLELVQIERKYGSEVYDLVKMIPALVRLAAAEKNEMVVRQLCRTCMPGFIGRGYGIRIDIPNETRFRALWHQEYLFQLRSLDGINFWTPLLPITPDLGPVIFALGSHRDGIHPVRSGDTSRPGAYALTLDQEDELVGRYPHVAPLSSPGDLIVLDFRTLHASGFNVSNQPRWSMQTRFFNFLDPMAIQIGWKGSVADGIRFQDIHPEFFINTPQETTACQPVVSAAS